MKYPMLNISKVVVTNMALYKPYLLNLYFNEAIFITSLLLFTIHVQYSDKIFTNTIIIIIIIWYTTNIVIRYISKYNVFPAKLHLHFNNI